MKKTLTLVAAGLLFAGSLKAQLYIGPRAGFNMPSVVANYGQPGFTTGFHGGLTFKYKFNPHFSVSADPMYTTLGFQDKTKTSTIMTSPTATVTTVQTNDVKNTFNYAQMPITANMAFRMSGPIVVPYDDIDPYIDFNIFAGPYVGYFLSGKQNGNITTVTYTDDNVLGRDTTTDKSNRKSSIDASKVNPIDVGVVGGVGFTFHLGYGNSILLNAAYGMGLMSMNNKLYTTVNNEGETISYDVRNQYFQVSLAYVVRIGKRSIRH